MKNFVLARVNNEYNTLDQFYKSDYYTEDVGTFRFTFGENLETLLDSLKLSDSEIMKQMENYNKSVISVHFLKNEGDTGIYVLVHGFIGVVPF